MSDDDNVPLDTPSVADETHLGTVNIRPGAAILSVLKHLNYRTWFAFAEFVDNSVQSFLRYRGPLDAVNPTSASLQVDIEVVSSEPPFIRIVDNAAGIALADFQRAFRPAAIPLDRTGLSEFGMGMKSAACWFAPSWEVRTQALGDDVIRTVRFDVARIVRDAIEEVVIHEESGKPGDHFTTVTLNNPYHVPVGKTVAKIKEHLTDIYRCFTREKTLRLRFNGEPLVYKEPNVLEAAYERDGTGIFRRWHKEIEFDFGCGLFVKGFAALMERGSFPESGFALFRRGRLIEGSGDEGYRPNEIFGVSAGSYRRLRLFGELHLEGFNVSHTKDGFRWDENEEPFIKLLKEHLDSDDLPLLRQADTYRILVARNERLIAANQALARTAVALREHLPKVFEHVVEAPLVETSILALPTQTMLTSREFSIEFRNEKWTIKVELSDHPGFGDWLWVSDQLPVGTSEQILQIRVAMAHPFMIVFAQTDAAGVEAVIRIAAALALGEILARRSGLKASGTVRRNVNEILRDALAKA